MGLWHYKKINCIFWQLCYKCCIPFFAISARKNCTQWSRGTSQNTQSTLSYPQGGISRTDQYVTLELNLTLWYKCGVGNSEIRNREDKITSQKIIWCVINYKFKKYFKLYWRGKWDFFRVFFFFNLFRGINFHHFFSKFGEGKMNFVSNSL